MSGATRERLTLVTDAAERSVYYDETRGTYHTWCTTTDYEPVSTAVLMALSSIRGVGIENLESLSDSVHPDALNSIVVHWTSDESAGRNGSVTFPFAQCTVTVRADGEVVIDPERDADGPAGS